MASAAGEWPLVKSRLMRRAQDFAPPDGGQRSVRARKECRDGSKIVRRKLPLRDRRDGAPEAVRTVRFRRHGAHRSEEHTSELQSQSNLVCRLLLEKKKKKNKG